MDRKVFTEAELDSDFVFSPSKKVILDATFIFFAYKITDICCGDLKDKKWFEQFRK